MLDRITLKFNDGLKQGRLFFSNETFEIWLSDKSHHNSRLYSIENHDVIRQHKKPSVKKKSGISINISLSDHENNQFICIPKSDLIMQIGIDAEPKKRKISELLSKNIFNTELAKNYYQKLVNIFKANDINFDLLFWCWSEALYKAGLGSQTLELSSQNKEMINLIFDDKSIFSLCIQINNLENYLLIKDDWMIAVVLSNDYLTSNKDKI